jgi:hypothetical protein
MSSKTLEHLDGIACRDELGAHQLPLRHINWLTKRDRDVTPSTGRIGRDSGFLNSRSQ